MTLFILAFLLYLVGFLGALIEGAGELWLWFLALGVVLDITLDSVGLPGVNQAEVRKR